MGPDGDASGFGRYRYYPGVAKHNSGGAVRLFRNQKATLAAADMQGPYYSRFARKNAGDNNAGNAF